MSRDPPKMQLTVEKRYNVYTEEGGSDHVILPDPVLLPVESLSSYSGGITC